MAIKHSPRIVTDGLVLHLDAANTKSYPGSGTTWTDISGKSNNGTLTNGPTFDSGNMGSIVLDGSNDYVSETSGLTDSFLQGNWSISFWVKFDALSTVTQGPHDRILLHHGSAGNNTGLHIVQRNSKLRFGLYNNDLDSTLIFSQYTWYNIVFTLNNSSYAKQIYINGSINSSHTGSGAYTGTGANTRIAGKVLGFGKYLDGNMSNVSAYNKVLTATEVKQNYDALKWRYI